MRKLTLSICWCVLTLALCGTEVVNLWSGRPVTLPGNGRWTITTGHGRILASGHGEIRLELPALEPGTALDAELTLNGEKQKLRFHSPQPLSGWSIAGDNSLPPQQLRLLMQLGAGLLAEPPDLRPDGIAVTGGLPPATDRTDFPAGKLTLCFPDKRDFPLAIGGGWERISGGCAKNSGVLSVYYGRKEQQLDLNGELTWIRLEKEGMRIVIFTPGMDLNEIDNVLLVRQFMEETK